MGKIHDFSPFMFQPTVRSYDLSESTPPSSSSSAPLSPSFCSSRSNSSFNSPYKSLSGLPRPPLSNSSSSPFPPAVFGPCAACKFHNRCCSEKCYLATFFPPDDVHKFAVVDSLFGSVNVVSFLQQNSNSPYIPLLLLLRDTSREDGEIHSYSKNNIHKQQLDESMNSNHGRELTQGRELAKQLKNDVAPTITASNGPTKFPIYMDGTPGSVNSDAVHSHAAKKRKAVLRCDFRVSSENGLEERLDDGHSWIKYAQKDVGTKYPRCYFTCTYAFTHNCWATKEVQRSDEDPNIFEVTYHEIHTCSPPIWPVKQEEKQNNISRNDEEQQSEGFLLGFQNSEEQKLEEILFSLQNSTNASASNSPATELDNVWISLTTVEDTLPSLTQHVRVSSASENGLEYPVDDGYSWIKYEWNDVRAAKYTRSYRCIYRNTRDCLATKRVQRSDEDPTIFEVLYQGKHTCSLSQQRVSPPPPPPPPALLEKQEQTQNSNDQQQQYLGSSFNLRHSVISPFLEPEFSFQPLGLDPNLNVKKRILSYYRSIWSNTSKA